MLPQSEKVLEEFQIRKSRKQKARFRAWLCGELEAAGYSPETEESFTARNVVIGDPENAKIIFSAHYDTCAVLPIPNFITPRNMFFYLLYQMLFLLIFFVVVLAAELAIFFLTDASPEIGLAVSYLLCIFMVWWIIDGPANKHTANDNTSGVITLLETALTMPEEDRKQVCFVFFDNEEKGMLGSAAFAKRHKKAKRETLNINYDCVSDGDFIQFFPDSKLKKDGEALERIERSFTGNGQKRMEVVRGFGFYPSDNKVFKKGVGVCALKYKKIVGYYMDRIHTGRDTVFEEENIELLRRGAIALAAGYRVEKV